MKKVEKKNKDRDKKWKIILLLALLFAVSGVTWGFAAISRHIIIQAEQKVKPNQNDFKVQFSSNQNGISQPIVIPITYPRGVKATNAYIDNSGKISTIKNLSAEFTEPGQSATYSFYAYNSGKYEAYLKSINFNNIEGKETNKLCTAIGTTSQSIVDKVCDDINITIKVGKENPTISTIRDINSHILLRNNPEPIIVTIYYDEDSIAVDGGFSVKFGQITLNYSSVD